MLNIELIRFEVQDVITSSIATPVVPEDVAPLHNSELCASMKESDHKPGFQGHNLALWDGEKFIDCKCSCHN